jgi:hypothetical protein
VLLLLLLMVVMLVVGVTRTVPIVVLGETVTAAMPRTAHSKVRSPMAVTPRRFMKDKRAMDLQQRVAAAAAAAAAATCQDGDEARGGSPCFPFCLSDI